MALCDTHKYGNKDLKHASAVQPEFITSLTDHGRRCSQGNDFDPLANKSKQICIFIKQEEYDRIWGNSKAFRQYLDDMILQHPELFPVTIQQGYILHDILPESKKMTGIRLRRIKVKAKDGNGGDVFTIRPSFVMPYMVGYTNDVEKPLFYAAGEFLIGHWRMCFGRLCEFRCGYRGFDRSV